MRNWEIFENYSCQTLNDEFNELGIYFKNKGGSDSMESDLIAFNSKNNSIFNMEIKLCPSQAGQFVINLLNNQYVLTENSSLTNSITPKIIDYINNNLDFYTSLRSTKNINCDTSILVDWIVNHYTKKGNTHIISSTKKSKYLAIIPIEEIKNHFTVSACIRRKKSGSRSLPLREQDESIIKARLHLEKLGIKICESTKNKKTLLTLNNPEPIKKIDLYFGDDLFLSQSSQPNLYEIKKLSSTNNENVIFSLTSRSISENYGFDAFKKFIQLRL